MKLTNEFDPIREWAEERGLYAKGDVKTQFIKLATENGELAEAILADNTAELKDAIGDKVVVLTNLAHLAGTTLEECVNLAYQEIKNRKGSMINGTFVKEKTLLTNTDMNDQLRLVMKSRFGIGYKEDISLLSLWHYNNSDMGMSYFIELKRFCKDHEIELEKE